MTEDIQDLRRKRLDQWVEKNGGAAKVVRDKKLPASTVSYLSQIIKSGYSFAERAARNMEERLGMPAGYLDQDEVDLELEEMVSAYRALPPSAREKAKAYIDGLADGAPSLVNQPKGKSPFRRALSPAEEQTNESPAPVDEAPSRT